MDNTEDVSTRFILGQILSTEVPRTPMIPSGSTQAPSTSGTRRSSRISVRDAGAQTPTDLVRHSMKRRISQSITQKSQPAPRRTASFVRRKTRSSASMLFDDDQSPRLLLENILMTDNVKSPLVHEKTSSEEPEPPSASSFTSNTHPSIELSDLDLPDLTVGNVVSTAKGLNRKRPRRSLNVTAFEKRLRGADAEAEERRDEASGDISSLSLSSSTSLSLKTPFVDVGTERKGLQRKASQRRKITEEGFGAAVDKQQITGGATFLPGKQDLGDTTHWEGFTLGQSKLSEPDVTMDILHCNTALYPQPDTITSDLSIIATQDKLTVAASQIQKDLEEREELMKESEEELNKVQGQTDEEGGVTDSQREDEAASRYEEEEEVIGSGSNAEEEEGTADSATQEDIEADTQPEEEEVVECEFQEEVAESESQEEVVECEFQEEVVESESQEEAVESESQEEAVESESQEEAVESESQEETVESESQEEAVESESQEEAVESESQEEAVESESQEEAVESESQEEAVESESQEEAVESESQEEAVESESQEEAVESESQEEAVESESQEEAVESESQEEAVESDSQEEAVTASESDEDEGAAASQTSNNKSSSFHPEPDHRADSESVADGEKTVDKAEHPSEDCPTDFEPLVTMDTSSQFEEDGITSGNNEKDDGKTERQRSERLDSNLELISRRSHRSDGALIVPVVQEDDLDKAREGSSEVKSKDLGSTLEMEQDENMVEPSNLEQRDASDAEDEEYPTEFSPEEEDEEEGAAARGASEQKYISSKTPAFVRAKRNFFIPDPSDSPTVLKDNQASGTTQAVPAAKPKRARQVKKRSTVRKALPKGYLMTVFRHFAKTKVASDVYPLLDEIMDKFFDRLADDMETYAAHAKRTTIDVEDVVLLLKRQGYVNDKVPVEVLIEKYLRMDQRRLLIPIATSGNVVIPKIRK